METVDTAVGCRVVGTAVDEGIVVATVDGKTVVLGSRLVAKFCTGVTDTVVVGTVDIVADGITVVATFVEGGKVVAAGVVVGCSVDTTVAGTVDG